MPRSRQKKSPEEEAEARRRHAEQERLRRAKMTEEQLLEDRARHAARQRRRYADMRYAAIVSERQSEDGSASSGDDDDQDSDEDYGKGNSAKASVAKRNKELEQEGLRKQKRANMTPEQKAIMLERNRILNHKPKTKDQGQNPDESGSSEWTDQSEDEGLNEKDKEEKRRQRREVDRLRKKITRANFPHDALARARELGRLRSRAKRANMTPTERVVQRQKDTNNARERRAKRRLQGGEQYQQHLLRQAAAARERRRQKAQLLYPAENAPDPSSVIPGETIIERERRLQREHRLKIRGQRDPIPVSILARERAHDRIADRIDRILNKKEEILMRKDLGPYRKARRYGTQTNMEPEEEDNWAWKDLLYHELKVEFQKERNILRDEALLLEIGDGIPDKQSPLEDPDWITNLGNSASLLYQRNRVYSSATATQGTNKGPDGNHSENEDDDDEATAAVLSAFNQVEIKIEAEDYDDWDGNGIGFNSMETLAVDSAEADVADWIARVITGEQEQSQDTAGGLKHSKFAQTQAVQKFQDIMRASRGSGEVYSESNNALLTHFKSLAIKRAQDEKLEDLRKTFNAARQRWVTEKPDEDEKRAAVDQERVTLKETLQEKKKAGVKIVIQELIHKRDFFSQESAEARATRIAELYATVESDLTLHREMREKLGKLTQEEIEERRKKKLLITRPLTKEEKRKIDTEKAMIRVKMEKLEYEEHIDLLMASGFPLDVPKFACLEIPRRKQILEDVAKSGESLSSLARFENTLKHEPYVSCAIYFNGIKAMRTRSEMISYRRLLVELIGKRRRRINLANNGESVATTSSDQQEQTQPPGEEFEWTGVPEDVSLQDYERFKDFITKYGEPVLEHLKFKRYYQNERMKFYSTKHNKSLSTEKREAIRIKQNASLRKYYIRKKYGIELGPGEYFDKKTMSSVKKPAKAYAAYQRKAEERESLGLAPGEELPYEDSEPEYSEKPKRSRKKKNPNAIPRKRGPGKNNKKAKPSTSASSATGGGYSGSVGVDQTMAYPGHTSSGRNYTATAKDDYSNSGDGDVHHNDDSDEGWVPLGSYEIDSVIRHDILNMPMGTQQNQNFQFSQCQPQQHHSGHVHNTRSSTSGQHQLQHQSYQQFATQVNQQHHSMPSLTLVDQFTGNSYTHSATGQWNTGQGLTSTQPLNYSLQFLPNSQISLIQNQQISHLALASNAQQTYAWAQPSTSTNQNQNPYSRNYNTPLHHQQPQYEYDVVTSTPSSSLAAEDSHSLAGSEDVSLEDSTFSRPKSRGGRPKGSKNRAQSSLHKLKSTNITRKRNTFPPGAPKRDIWNNRQRRKFYTQSGIAPTPPIPSNDPVRRPHPLVESPFERNPQECRDAALQEHISLLLPKCPHCDAILDDEGMLQRHIASAHQQREFIIKPCKRKGMWANIQEKVSCSICSSELISPGALVEHFFLSHFAVGQFKCPFAAKAPRTTKRWREVRCASFRFGRASLRDHIQVKHPEEGKTCWVMGINQPKMMIGKSKFCCLHCGNDYPNFSELKEHYKATHDMVRYCCVHCGIYLRAEDFWLDHVKLFHPEKPLRPAPPSVIVDAGDGFRCAECDSEFSAQTFLDAHLASGHSLVKGSAIRAKSFPCRACDKQFRTEEMRDAHFKNCKHRNHECYWCRCKFVSGDVLDKHVADSHPNEPPVPTDQDNFTFSHEPYKCELCKRSYMSLYSLRLHCFYNHELYKYLQTIKDKYPTLSEEAAQLAAATEEKQKSNPPQEKSSVKPSKAGDTAPMVPIPWISTEEPHQEIDPNAKLISCPVCNTPGHNLHQTHKAYDKLMRRYCFPCERLFSRANVLRQHNEAAHGQAPDAIISHPPPCGRPGKLAFSDNPEEYLECCQRVFTKEEFHHHHLFFEKDPDIRVCGICSRKFFNHPAYLKHVHEEHGVPKNMKMVVYKKPPPTAPVEPPPKRQLQEEDYEKLSSTTTMSTSGGEITIFSCKVCLKNFKTQAFLRTHIEENHKEDAFTRVMCNKCNTTFASKQNLLKHIKFHHNTDLVKYLCPVCNVPIRRIDHLKVHHTNFHPDHIYDKHQVKTVPIEEANEATNQISCKICSTSFSTETGLKSHMTNRHFPTHWSTFCTFCGLQMNPKAMKAHISKDHPGKEEPTTNKRTRLSLPEVFDLVQALIEKCGVKPDEIKGSKPSRKKRISTSSPKAIRKSTRSKKPRQNSSSDSEDEDGNGDDAQIEDAFALHYMSSESEEEEDPAVDLNAINDYDEVTQSGSDDEEEPDSKRPKISSIKKEPKSATRSCSRQGRTATKAKTKARIRTRKPITRKKAKKVKNLYCDDSEDEDVKRPIVRPSRRSLRSREAPPTLEDNKKLIVPLERCDELYQLPMSNDLPPVPRKPGPKSRQNRDNIPLIKVETQLEELDVDFVIKDEPQDFDEDSDMGSVIQHNLESLQWEYVQTPGDQDQDLSESDPLS